MWKSNPNVYNAERSVTSNPTPQHERRWSSPYPFLIAHAAHTLRTLVGSSVAISSSEQLLIPFVDVVVAILAPIHVHIRPGRSGGRVQLVLRPCV